MSLADDLAERKSNKQFIRYLGDKCTGPAEKGRAYALAEKWFGDRELPASIGGPKTQHVHQWLQICVKDDSDSVLSPVIWCPECDKKRPVPAYL